jgi:uridine phosphorylase
MQTRGLDKRIETLLEDNTKEVKKRVGRPPKMTEEEYYNSQKTKVKKILSTSGRNKKYTPTKLRNKVIDYFTNCYVEAKPPTVTGLTLHLKISRETFYSYMNDLTMREVLETARYMMENWLEEKLVMSKQNPTGIIFALKNRFGWKDVQTVENTTNEISEEEILAKIAALAPKLIEVLEDNKPKLIVNNNNNIVDVEVE